MNHLPWSGTCNPGACASQSDLPGLALVRRLPGAVGHHRSAFRGRPRTIAPTPFASVAQSSAARTAVPQGRGVPNQGSGGAANSHIRGKVGNGGNLVKIYVRNHSPTNSRSTKHSPMSVSLSSPKRLGTRKIIAPLPIRIRILDRAVGPTSERLRRSAARPAVGSAPGYSTTAAPQYSVPQSCARKVRRRTTCRRRSETPQLRRRSRGTKWCQRVRDSAMLAAPGRSQHHLVFDCS